MYGLVVIVFEFYERFVSEMTNGFVCSGDFFFSLKWISKLLRWFRWQNKSISRWQIHLFVRVTNQFVPERTKRALYWWQICLLRRKYASFHHFVLNHSWASITAMYNKVSHTVKKLWLRKKIVSLSFHKIATESVRTKS